MKTRAMIMIAALAVASTQAFAQTITAYDLRNGGRFLDFDVSTPLTQNVLGTGTPTTVRSIDFDGSGNLFALNNPTATPNRLQQVNMADGSFTSDLEITGIITGEGVSGLAIGSSATFMSAIGNGITSLYSLDLGTGAATLIGSMGATSMIDIAIDSQGNLFGMDITSDALFSINTSTGAATSIGLTGFATSFSQGMDFDTATDTLYATLYTGGGTGALATIDTTTGSATSLADLASLNGEYEMAVNPVPEPASMLALAAGAALIARRKRK